MEHEVAISHLRDVLGFAVRQVASTGEPVIIRRYKRAEVILVPLGEWRRLQQIEAERSLDPFDFDDDEPENTQPLEKETA